MNDNMLSEIVNFTEYLIFKIIKTKKLVDEFIKKSQV